MMASGGTTTTTTQAKRDIWGVARETQWGGYGRDRRVASEKGQAMVALREAEAVEGGEPREGVGEEGHAHLGEGGPQARERRRARRVEREAQLDGLEKWLAEGDESLWEAVEEESV